MLIVIDMIYVPCQGWEVTVIKQEESTEGPLEMQIALPSMPSLYIISFLYQACLEIHKIGGHILDKSILQNFAWDLLQKVMFFHDNLFFFEGVTRSNCGACYRLKHWPGTSSKEWKNQRMFYHAICMKHN
jgi:hypothetical protein